MCRYVDGQPILQFWHMLTYVQLHQLSQLYCTKFFFSHATLECITTYYNSSHLEWCPYWYLCFCWSTTYHLSHCWSNIDLLPAPSFAHPWYSGEAGVGSWWSHEKTSPTWINCAFLPNRAYQMMKQPPRASSQSVTRTMPLALGIERQFHILPHTVPEYVFCFPAKTHDVQMGRSRTSTTWKGATTPGRIMVKVTTTKIIRPLNIAMGSPNLEKPQWMVHIATYC